MTSTLKSSDFLASLRACVGEAHVLSDATQLQPYLTDWRGRYHGAALAVVHPGSTAEISAVVQACYAAGVAIVPQGGNTSLCGGATPDSSGETIVLGLSRLNRIRAIDARNQTITVEAGCLLAKVQNAARDVAKLFPLSLASEGSCQIGGNLSTNAGGVQVLRYGNMRELTLGLEVVLPDGRILDGLRGLRKDNTGYDLKHLFIGAEGTLGIITAAVLKLFPQPRSRVTTWLSVSSVEVALAVLDSAQSAFDAQLTAFELITPAALELVIRHIPGTQAPLPDAPYFVLCELAGYSDGLLPLVESWLNQEHEASRVIDAVVAHSETQEQKLWHLRESISEAQKIEGLSIKHDIAVPVSRIPEFLERAEQCLATNFPDLRVVAFGHLGDGNLHFNLSLRQGNDNASLLAQQGEVNRLVHDLVDELGGSISAEHGLGQLKRDEICRYKSPVEMGVMHAVKNALDPKNLMNPGKVL